MALMACHECKKEYSSEAAACIHCGAKNNYHKKPMGLFGMLAIVVIGLFVLFIGLGAVVSSNDPTYAERSKAQDAISFCDSEYKRLNSDPRTSAGMLRIASGACDKMKNDYRSKWNREP